MDFLTNIFDNGKNQTIWNMFLLEMDIKHIYLIQFEIGAS